MATKEEIREWLEACGAERLQLFAYKIPSPDREFMLHTVRVVDLEYIVGVGAAVPLHLLNPELTGVQGPTFAEWKKQKGREGKVRKMEPIISRAYMSEWTVTEFAHKILDAIEGEGK